MNEEVEVSVALAALYLRGLSPFQTVSSSSRAAALGALRRGSGPMEDRLRRAGLVLEASVVGSPGHMARAEALLASGSVVTSACRTYPSRWRRFPFAASALWRTGEMQPQSTLLTVVGSRNVDSEVLAWCASVGRAAVRAGIAVASGGAEGCDRASGATLEIWPCGIHTRPVPEGVCVLSACAPGEPFAAAFAMERNGLLYALADHAVIGHARYREGGTWTGAVDAVRRRLTQLWVSPLAGRAGAALFALGAAELTDPELAATLDEIHVPSRQLVLPEVVSRDLAVAKQRAATLGTFNAH